MPHPPLFFNNIQGSQYSFQKHLGVILHEQLTLCEHLKMVASKTNKTIGLLRKLQNLSASSSLFTIYKSLVRLHVDDGEIIYDKTYNASFHQKLEIFQYNACLAMTGAIRGAS